MCLCVCVCVCVGVCVCVCERERERERENSNLKTLFSKDCSLERERVCKRVMGSGLLLKKER